MNHLGKHLGLGLLGVGLKESLLLQKTPADGPPEWPGRFAVSPAACESCSTSSPRLVWPVCFCLGCSNRSVVGFYCGFDSHVPDDS